MRKNITRAAAILSACCIFSAFAVSCSENTGKKKNSSEDEPEKTVSGISVSPEDFSAAVFSDVGSDGLYEEFDTLFAAAGAVDPFVSNIGYMVDDDVLNIGWLGNDDPFNSFDHMLSSATGNTPDYEDNFIPKAYFKAIDVTYNYNEDIVQLDEYADHMLFQCNEGLGDAYVNVEFTMPETGRLCFNIGSEYYTSCNIWISNTKDGGEFTDFSSVIGYYGVDGVGHVIDAGTFNKGEEIQVRFTIISDNGGGNYSGNEYLMVRKNSGFNFYYADEAALNEDLEQFSAQPFVLDEKKSSYDELVGTVTAEDGKILMTCLPYDQEHNIKVDGKKFDSLVDKDTRNSDGDEGEVVVFGKFIGLKLPEGEHEIEISFTKEHDEEYEAAEEFTKLIYEGSEEKLLNVMFPDDFLSETDAEELTDLFVVMTSSFEEHYPDCRLISKSIRRIGDASEKELSGIDNFYREAYERFDVDYYTSGIEKAAKYQLILEYENSSGETERAYQLVSAADINGKWCFYFF